MSQRQCKRMRKFMRWVEDRMVEHMEILEYMERRPPMWRVIARIKWEREGRKFYDQR